MKEIKIDEKVYYAVRKMPYSILESDRYETILGIEKGSINFKYCKREKIKISIGKQVEFEIDEIEWNNLEILELYPKAISLISELIQLDKNLEPYNYYIAIKEKLEKYFELAGTELIFSTKYFTISTINGKIVDYQDLIKGIIIKNYNNWYNKSYCTENARVVFEKDKIIEAGVKSKEIQQFIETAEKVIQEVELLEY